MVALYKITSLSLLLHVTHYSDFSYMIFGVLRGYASHD